MKRYLLLVGDRNGQFFYNIENNEEVKVFSMYKKLSKPQRLLRKLFSASVTVNKFLYGEWKEEDNIYDCIICEDCTVDSAIFTYLRKNFSKAKIVFWFRNSLEAVDYTAAKKRNLSYAKRCDQIISFDREDCEKYGFSYIENCYALDPTIKKTSLKYDMIFMGTDKSRYNILTSIIKRTEEFKWNNYIHIYSYTRKENEYVKHKFMDYKEYLKILVDSKAILDVVDENYQNGYSLRIFEALFYKKKLITNHQMIKKEPFYNPNNIYVFDANDMRTLDDLKSFLDKPYIEISEKILKLYNFEEWIRRI